MNRIVDLIAKTLASAGGLLVRTGLWVGQLIADLTRKLLNKPLDLAVRVHLVVFGILVIAATFAESWDIWHRLIMPLIHSTALKR